VLKDGKLSRYGPLPATSQLATPWQIDEDLSVVTFETLDGAIHSVLLNYTAHPVVTMLLPQISADYPGTATRLVEQHFPGSICLFTQGAAGNVNSVFVSSKHEDALTLGEKLMTAAVTRIEQLKTQPAVTPSSLRHKSTFLHLEPRDCPTLSEARARAEAQPTPANLRVLRLAQKLADGPLRAEIQLLSVGALRWLSLPGEPFVETGLNLKAHGATFVCGYSNGWLGYFPLRRAYGEGGYEVDLGAWSRVAPGSAELLEAKAIELLRNS
jgi:hypothetical protein